MKVFFIIFIFTCLSLFSKISAQFSYSGLWKGAIYTNKIDDSTALIVYFSISKYKDISEALVRIEKPGSISYSTIKLRGELKDSTLVYLTHQLVKSKDLKFSIDKNNIKLKYIDSTGYLEGNIINSSNGMVTNKIVLFKTDGSIDSQEKKEISHAWFALFQKEYNQGLLAPNLREFQRKNFTFESVYFDPTKSELKKEYYPYLMNLIKVVNSHTDLRLKVIGHTDWNGSDKYNEELSKKRAETIFEFLEKNGLSRDRIEYEFQGEKRPVDNNETPQGRKRNRRVDFQFI